MGMLRVREGKSTEALQSLERAVKENSQNYLIHYYYAYALSRVGHGEGELVTGFTPESVSKMREHLMKAIEMRPDFPESYSLLALVNLVSGDNLDESVQMLKRALTISPGRNDLVFMLAQVYMRKDDNKSASDIFRKLSENNSDPELRQRAQAMLAQLVAREEEMARYRNSGGDSGNRPPLPDSVNSGAQPEVIGSVDPQSYLREALRNRPQAKPRHRVSSRGSIAMQKASPSS